MAGERNTQDGAVQVTFLPIDCTVEGKLGDSILETAEANRVELEHACHGAAVCGTCHVIVREGADLLSEQEDEEWDGLDNAKGVTPNSRLSCQARLVKPGRVVLEVPES